MTDTVATDPLAASGAPPSAEDRRHPRMLGERYRRVLWQWTVHDFRGRYRRGGIQAGWAVLQPLFFVAVYVLVFGIIFDADSGDVPYLTYLLSGMVVFRVISMAVSANTCISDNLHMLSHSSMPSEVIPLAQVVSGLVDLGVVLLAFLVTALVQGVSFHATIVLLPLILVPVVALAAAVAVSLSIVQVFVPDVRFAGTIVVQALFFASPITYSPDQLPSWLDWLNTVNPISVFIAAVRAVSIEGTWPDWPLLAVHTVGALVLVVASITHFRAVQHRIVDLG